MIRDIRQYWREIRALEVSLPDFVWLAAADPKLVAASRDQEFVHCIEVTGPNAARLLHQKTHRVATAEEVAAYRAHEAKLERAALTERLRREGRARVPMRPEQESEAA